MKKTVLLVILLSLFSFLFAGNVVTVDNAKTVSKNFISATCSSQNLQFELSDFTLQHTEYDQNGEAVYYRFSIGEEGFIIISATDLVSPVLAYSVTSNFESNPEVDAIVKGYKEQIIYVKQHNSVNTDAAKEWNYLLNNQSNTRSVRADNYISKEIEPLITTIWNQTKFYNAYCPYHSAATSSQQSSFEFDNRVPVGCVAVNMGVLMYYYRYPEVGVGGVSYVPVSYEFDEENNPTDTFTYARQTVNFGQTNYNYNAMCDNVDQYTGEVAKLLWHSGVSTFMGYSPTGSGAQSANALEAMKLNWKYNQTAAMESRTGHSVVEWENILTNELDSMRPLYYSASRSDGGHAFILDGYQRVNQIDVTITYTDSIMESVYDTTYQDIYDTTGYNVTIDTTETTDSNDLFLHWDYIIEDEVIVDSTAIYGIVTFDSVPITVVIGTLTIVDTNYIAHYTDSTVVADTVFLHNMFHVNWGWGGASNGYFRVSGSGYLSGYAENEAAFTNFYPAGDITKPTEGNIRITSSTGSISDGAGSKKYQPNTDRTWVIATPEATRYIFDFAKLKTEEGGVIIKFYNAGTNAEIASYSGHTIPVNRVIDADSVLIRFTSNGNDIVDYGFVINFSTVIGNQYCALNSTNSTGLITDQMGRLSDKGDNFEDFEDDTPYRAQSVCNWRFFQSEQYRVYFSVEKFEMGYGDFVDIFDVSVTNKPVLLRRYDIYNFPDGILTCDARRIKVTFVSDNWIEGNGFEMTYQTCTGIDDNSGLHNVAVYPNPASDYLYIDLTSEVQGNLSLNIMDMTGNVVSTENVNYFHDNSHNKINLNNLSKGIYMLSIQSSKGNVVRKFIV